MRKRPKVTPFAAFVAGCGGDLGPLVERLRQDGHEELADAFDAGDVAFQRLSEKHDKLLLAAVEFRDRCAGTDWRLVAKELRAKNKHRGWDGTAADARSQAIDKQAERFGVDSEQLHSVLDADGGGTWRALKPHLKRAKKTADD